MELRKENKPKKEGLATWREEYGIKPKKEGLATWREEYSIKPKNHIWHLLSWMHYINMFLKILASSRTSSGPLNQREMEMVEKKKKSKYYSYHHVPSHITNECKSLFFHLMVLSLNLAPKKGGLLFLKGWKLMFSPSLYRRHYGTQVSNVIPLEGLYRLPYRIKWLKFILGLVYLI